MNIDKTALIKVQQQQDDHNRPHFVLIQIFLTLISKNIYHWDFFFFFRSMIILFMKVWR